MTLSLSCISHLEKKVNNNNKTPSPLPSPMLRCALTKNTTEMLLFASPSPLITLYAPAMRWGGGFRTKNKPPREEAKNCIEKLSQNVGKLTTNTCHTKTFKFN